MGLFTDGLDPKYKTAEFLDALEDAEQRERFIKVLVQIRKDAGLRQQDVAEAMGVGQSTLSQFENAVDPRLSTVQRYARAVGAEVHFFASRRSVKAKAWLVSDDVQPRRIGTWDEPSAVGSVGVTRSCSSSFAKAA